MMKDHHHYPAKDYAAEGYLAGHRSPPPHPDRPLVGAAFLLGAMVGLLLSLPLYVLVLLGWRALS
jgi:hypothetical protein